MPASSKNTTIRLMRGDTASSEAWIPEKGEPLLDMDTGTLCYGDGTTLGGIPINTCTATLMDTPANLNRCITWGRYFLDGEIFPLPRGISSPAKIILSVYSADLGSAEILQVINILNGEFGGKTFNRVSLTKGITWSEWVDLSGNSMTNTGSGADENEHDLSKFVYRSDVFIEGGLVGGPEGTNKCSAFLNVFRRDGDSPHIYQKLTIVGGGEHNGEIYDRYSANENKDWNSPGFNWRLLTDAVQK